jgi:hypothetical protein
VCHWLMTLLTGPAGTSLHSVWDGSSGCSPGRTSAPAPKGSSGQAIRWNVTLIVVVVIGGQHLLPATTMAGWVADWLRGVDWQSRRTLSQGPC